MAKLVLLIVAAVWAAVLIPPLLRSRIENRPNSSVVDFRRQLSKLQSSSTPARGAVRAIGRPLTASPRQRSHGAATISTRDYRDVALRRPPAGRDRQGLQRPAARRPGPPQRDHHRVEHVRHDDQRAPARRHHGTASRADERRPRASQPARTHRGARVAAARANDPLAEVKRRRSNVLFLLLVVTGGTLFLYATTKSDVLMYVFALSFLALCGYVYLLAQLRQRESSGWGDGWLEH